MALRTQPGPTAAASDSIAYSLLAVFRHCSTRGCAAGRYCIHHRRSAILSGMGKVEKIEREVASLSTSELATFREWYASFDADAWDRRIEDDASAGRLDALATQAIDAHRAGMTKAL